MIKYTLITFTLTVTVLYLSSPLTQFDHDSQNSELDGPFSRLLSEELPNTTTTRLYKELWNYRLHGVWEKNIDPEGKYRLGEINQPNGTIRIIFREREERQFLAPPIKTLFVYVTLAQGDYSDDMFYTVNFFNTHFDEKTRTISEYQTSAYLKRLDNPSEGTLYCDASFQLDLSQIITDEAVPKLNLTAKAPFVFKAGSQDCRFSAHGELEIQLTRKTIRRKDVNVLLIVIAIVSILANMLLRKKTQNNPVEANKYSLISLGLAEIWDFFILWFHFKLGLVFDDLFSSFVVGFSVYLYLVLYILGPTAVVWSNRDPQFATYPYCQRFQKVIRINAMIIGGIFVGSYLIQFFGLNPWFLFLSSFILVPQIIQNGKEAEQLEGNQWAFYTYAFFKLLLLIYARGCPENGYHLRPSLLTVALLSISIITQILVLEAQARFKIFKFGSAQRAQVEQYELPSHSDHSPPQESESLSVEREDP